MKLLQYSILFFFLIGLTGVVDAQKKKKIKYQAEGRSINGKINGETFRKLIDNVVFKQENTTVYCDSSIFYPERNVMEAFGRVRIVDDSVLITARKLIYDGDNRKTQLRENVIYTRGERRLYTDFLDYDLDAEIAHYFNNGKLVDTTNTLTSEIGYYYANKNYALFWNTVKLIAPTYVLETDTLRYNTITKVAYTFGPTEITQNDGSILHSQGSEFKTVFDQSQFIEGNVETDDYYLEGDSLFFDDLRKYYKAIGNVILTAKEKDIIITGNEAYYDKRHGLSKVYGDPLMKRILELDTFYIAADTMVSIESEYDSAKRVLAYYDVKMFKKGLQGIADSVSYFLEDSLIYFYKDPVMWNNNNQVEADTIYLEISENEIKKMNMISNSFLSQEDTIQNYNQIKGRDMVADFIENQISHIDVDGNGELLYYALEDGDSTVMGLNKIFTSSMRIRFEDQKLVNFSVYRNPEAQFIPPHEVTLELERLEGFSWRSEERPILFDLAPYLADSSYITLPEPATYLPLGKDETLEIDENKVEKGSGAPTDNSSQKLLKKSLLREQ